MKVEKYVNPDNKEVGFKIISENQEDIEFLNLCYNNKRGSMGVTFQHYGESPDLIIKSATFYTCNMVELWDEESNATNNK